VLSLSLVSLVAGASLLVDFAAVAYFLLTAAASRLHGVGTIVFSRSVGGGGGEAEWATAVARLSRRRRVCFQLPMARLSVRQHFLLLSLLQFLRVLRFRGFLSPPPPSWWWFTICCCDSALPRHQLRVTADGQWL
jgi:hypothetical protein